MPLFAKLSLATFALFLFSTSIFALEPIAPKMINLQAVVVDEGGNVIYNTQEDDVTFQIVDAAGTVHYEEVQHVVFVKGAMSVLVGSGNHPTTGQATGGIPPEALTPDGTRLLRYKLNNQTIPQEDLELASVPYSYYAQYALEVANPIESDEIQDGTIQTEDFSQSLMEYINNSISGISEQDLLDHKTERGAHEARAIIVDNSFIHAAGSDLQTVLEGLDNAIDLQDRRTDQIENTFGNLSIALLNINNIPGVLDETKIDPSISRNGHNHDADYVNVGGDTMNGDLTMQGADINMGGNEINGPVGGWTRAPVGATLIDHEARLNALASQESFEPIPLITGTTTCGTLSDTMLIEESCRLNTSSSGAGLIEIAPGFYFPVIGFRHPNANPSPPGTPASASFDPDLDYNLQFTSASPNTICLRVTINWNKNCGGGGGPSSGSSLEVTYGVYKYFP